ncbi:unnamed protein product [Arabidopsis thaliana]|uniref:EF-hand domain-containing protein n=1 Tax=Arabidopsis thaliana TaxID=3702 RepID=A0A5S9WU27_ARATH|nr:unnamed protein product [Arabidopsis thaliana]
MPTATGKSQFQSSETFSNPWEQIREAFDLYDQNKNGLISSSEIHKVLNRLGMTCSVEDCVRMIGHVDTDGDGNVNFEEFQKMMSSPELVKGTVANS